MEYELAIVREIFAYGQFARRNDLAAGVCNIASLLTSLGGGEIPPYSLRFAATAGEKNARLDEPIAAAVTVLLAEVVPGGRRVTRGVQPFGQLPFGRVHGG